MSDYTPNTESVRAGLVALARGDAARHGDVDLDVVASEVGAQFDRMIAEVEREAEARALEEFAEEMCTGYNTDTLNAERRAIKREARDRAAEIREGNNE